MNSLPPTTLSISSSGNGRILTMSSKGATTHLRALFCTDRFSVPGRDVGHGERAGGLTLGVAALMTDQVDLHEPGDHVAHVRIAIASFRSGPGLVCDRPRRVIEARAGASLRCIVPGTLPPAAWRAHR